MIVVTLPGLIIGGVVVLLAAWALITWIRFKVDRYFNRNTKE